jgi:pheromone shutdown-related protein TraB
MDVGVEPGAEMKAAIERAERHSVPIALIDRNIRVTLSRFWRSMSFIEKLRLIYALSVSMLSNEEESIDVELLTREDMITVAIDEFRKFSPRGAAALIDERDAYLASKILSLKSQHSRVLAVMGAGHIAGVNYYLTNPAIIPSISQLSIEPPTRAYGKIFGFIILALFLVLIIAIAFSGLGAEALIRALLYWVVIHAILSGIFALIAGGHPLSALTGSAVS